MVFINNQNIVVDSSISLVKEKDILSAENISFLNSLGIQVVRLDD